MPWKILGEALRAATPVDDFGLVDLISLVVGGRKTGRGADRAVDIDHSSARPADQMVVVVTDAIFESRLPGPVGWAQELVFATVGRRGITAAVRAAKQHLEGREA